jgi:hypothetical protein
MKKLRSISVILAAVAALTSLNAVPAFANDDGCHCRHRHHHHRHHRDHDRDDDEGCGGLLGCLLGGN